MPRHPALVIAVLLLAAESLAASHPPIASTSTSSTMTCSASAPERLLASSTVSNPHDCLAACGDFAPDAAAVMRASDEGYACVCAQAEELDWSDVDCSPDSWYAYEARSAPGTAESPGGHGVAESQLDAGSSKNFEPPLVVQNKRDRKRYIGLCAEGHRPCKVLGQDATYEVGPERL